MPVKKHKPIVKKTNTIHKAEPLFAGQPIGSALIIFILFISLTVVSFALYRVYEKQEKLINVINIMSNKVNQVPSTSDQTAPESKMQYRDADVSNLRLAYTPCPATFTGPCDDLMIYRLNESGSKEVLIPSVRAIVGSPLTSELLHPFAVNKDYSRIAFGAWAYGGKRNTDDKRVWIIESKSGRVLAESNLVPAEAIFSPDMLHAVYFSKDEKGVGQIMLIDISANVESLLTRETDSLFFKDAEGQLHINWLDNNILAVIQYQFAESGELQISGEREINIK